MNNYVGLNIELCIVFNFKQLNHFLFELNNTGGGKGDLEYTIIFW